MRLAASHKLSERPDVATAHAVGRGAEYGLMFFSSGLANGQALISNVSAQINWACTGRLTTAHTGRRARTEQFFLNSFMWKRPVCRGYIDKIAIIEKQTF